MKGKSHGWQGQQGPHNRHGYAKAGSANDLDQLAATVHTLVVAAAGATATDNREQAEAEALVRCLDADFTDPARRQIGQFVAANVIEGFALFPFVLSRTASVGDEHCDRSVVAQDEWAVP